MTQLSPRELEVARLAADGLSDKAIGRRLHISPFTVATYLQRILQKIGPGSDIARRRAIGRWFDEHASYRVV